MNRIATTIILAMCGVISGCAGMESTPEQWNRTNRIMDNTARWMEDNQHQQEISTIRTRQWLHTQMPNQHVWP